jgi:hypothetical protein
MAMIDLGKLKMAKVSDVPLGHLVLYTHATQPLFAVRVDGPGSNVLGLLLLCIDAGGSSPEPFLFPEIGDDFCLYIGGPTVAWDRDPTSVAGIEALGSSPLIITPEGIALMARVNQSSSVRLAWGLTTGTQLRYSHAYRVNKWQIGVIGMREEFVALVKYPEHYSEKARGSAPILGRLGPSPRKRSAPFLRSVR